MGVNIANSDSRNGVSKMLISEEVQTQDDVAIPSDEVVRRYGMFIALAIELPYAINIKPYEEVFKQAARFAEKMQVYKPVEPCDDWTKVTDRLPEENTKTIATNKGRLFIARHVMQNIWGEADGDGTEYMVNVTHWRPLPIPPKGDE